MNKPPMLSPHHSSDDDRSNSITSKNRSPFAYFGLTFVLSIPFWVAGSLTDLQLLPAIPVSALGFLSMVGAASILVHRENGFAGVAVLLRRSFDFNTAIALFVIFFITALCEQLGWSGYAIDPLQECFGALQASLILGAVWAE